MEYLKFCEALGLEPREDVREIYEGSWDPLQPLDTSMVAALMPNTADMLLPLAEEIAADPLKLRYVNLLKACYWAVPRKSLPILPQGPGKTFANLSPALVTLQFAAQAEAEMCRRGIPEDIRRYNHGAHERMLLNRQKIFGYPVMTQTYCSWAQHFLVPDLFVFDDLEFELRKLKSVHVFRSKENGRLVCLPLTGMMEDAYICAQLGRGGEEEETRILPKEQYDLFLTPEADVLSVHIPAGARIHPEACREKFAKALAFFHKYYPEREIKCFQCGSWMLDPTLADQLPAGSNILAFQKLFHRWPARSTGLEVFDFVHPLPFDSYEALPERTSLERLLKRRYLAEDPVYVYSGICPLEL